MLIAICSDSHDNFTNIERFLKYCIDNSVDVIFHCGDWTAPETFKMISNGFKGKLYGVLGNARIEPSEMINHAKEANISLEEFELSISLDSLRFGLVHKPQEANLLAKRNLHDIIFYGHTHKPWKRTLNKVVLINPGTLAGMFTPATFATYDTQTRKLELIRLDQLPFDQTLQP